MGKFNQGILGGFVGKVGGVVGYRSRGEWLYRSYQKIVANPKSEAQTKRREIFATISKQIASGCRANLNFLKKTGYEKNTWFSALVQAGMYLDAWGRNDVKTLGELAQKNYFARGNDMWNLGSMLNYYTVSTVGNAALQDVDASQIGENYFFPALDTTKYNQEYFDKYGKIVRGYVMFLNKNGLPQITQFLGEGEGAELVYEPTIELQPRCGWYSTNEGSTYYIKTTAAGTANSPAILAGTNIAKVPANNGKLPCFMFFTDPAGEPIGSCFRELEKTSA